MAAPAAVSSDRSSGFWELAAADLTLADTPAVVNAAAPLPPALADFLPRPAPELSPPGTSR